MEKVVYILDAGFSAPLGIPVMSNFLEKSKDLFSSDTLTYKHFQSVFNTIKDMSVAKNYYSTDLFNIEEILSILEMRNNLSDKKSSIKFQQYITDVINHYTPNFHPTRELPGNWQDFLFTLQTPLNQYAFFISHLLKLKFSFKVLDDYGQQTRQFLINYDHSSSIEYSVISLNYDLVLENFCEFLKKNYTTELDIRFDTEHQSNQNHEIPSLNKLHGSVNIGNIIPPTWNKTLNKKISSAWRNAHKKLTEANYIRIIGYSLPLSDAYVKYLLKSTVIDSDHLNQIDVLCLDDSIKTINKRYDEFILFNNYRFKNANVLEYFKQLYDTYKRSLGNIGRNDPVILNFLEKSHETFFN